MNKLQATGPSAILLFVEYFLPGYKFGGPVQAVANLVRLLKDTYTFFIVARDRDVGDTQPYPNRPANCWLRQDGYWVRYLSPDQINHFNINSLLTERPYRYVYTNSLFSRFTRQLLLTRTNIPLLLAPRGELHPGALRLKAWKKRPYVWLLRHCKAKDIRWHATDAVEQQYIDTHFPGSQVRIAPDVPNRLPRRPLYQKQAGQVRLLWLARIARNKGLLFLLNCLKQLPNQSVTLDIYGPIADTDYWHKCQRLLNTLPTSCCVKYRGPLPYPLIGDTISQYDFLALPSDGENFGHVIAESLSAGLPVLVSDQTPWQKLAEQGAGWAIPLQPDAWLTVLQTCVDMPDVLYQTLVANAPLVVESQSNLPAIAKQYNQLFTPEVFADEPVA
ncbi:glycosyltransferase [Spirosoma montaniterrae]|uniref:Uncharacterized protein n=1 Tax=Spirosoma montaniterrae TaxID=1178516 RepID=A0A1P9WYY6_9BACT|nr:glycosyltransferase [Spirosoma montaniterrae]AQG80573.1 hypothetical protein AWR27_15340 [Spirosoma montaniterrae]